MYRTGWRMVQFGAIRSRLATLKNREFIENNGHKVTPERKKTILECVLAKDAGGRLQTSQASIRPRSTPVSRVWSRPRAAYIVNFIKNKTYGKILRKMAGRKTKLAPERQEKILKCVRAGMTYKAAAESAGIALETLCRWIARGEKAESGLFHEFYESVQEALAHFEWVHLENIERSALKERQDHQADGEIRGRRNPKRPVERREGQVRYDRDEVSPAELEEVGVAARAAVAR